MVPPSWVRPFLFRIRRVRFFVELEVLTEATRSVLEMRSHAERGNEERGTRGNEDEQMIMDK